MRSSKRIALSKESYSIFEVFAIYEISVEPLEEWTNITSDCRAKEWALRLVAWTQDSSVVFGLLSQINIAN